MHPAALMMTSLLDIYIVMSYYHCHFLYFQIYPGHLHAERLGMIGDFPIPPAFLHSLPRPHNLQQFFNPIAQNKTGINGETQMAGSGAKRVRVCSRYCWMLYERADYK